MSRPDVSYPVRLRTCGLLGAVLSLAFLLPAVAEETSHAPRTIRVLTYNIHTGIGTDGKLDLERTASYIKSLKPDLVALQEVDNRTQRTGKVDQAAELAKLTGMHGEFGKAMDFDGGQYGKAVLSRWPIAEVVKHALPADSGFEPRAALAIRVDVPAAGPLWFVGTHLDHTDLAQQRLLQIDALNKALVSIKEPTLLAGDLNAEPTSEELNRLLAHWNDAGPAPTEQTWPSDKPSVRIDYILSCPQNRWRVIKSQVLDEKQISDHRPILAELEYLPAAD